MDLHIIYIIKAQAVRYRLHSHRMFRGDLKRGPFGFHYHITDSLRSWRRVFKGEEKNLEDARVPLARFEKKFPAPATQSTQSTQAIILIFLGTVFSFTARQEKDLK